ncbi:hypothetical protein FCOIX_11683 [Fusarium coicis]|nr:hypothetical protein FCOIX_11683 [Fusarium coicis]
MSSANIPPPNPGCQPVRPSPTLTVDNYWAEANGILQRLSETLKERAATKDPNDESIPVFDRFQQDPSIAPTLRAMLLSFLKLEPLEDLPPDEEMGRETFPAGDELRNRLKKLVETESKNDQEEEQKKRDNIAGTALCIWLLFQTKEERETEKSKGDVGGRKSMASDRCT